MSTTESGTKNGTRILPLTKRQITEEVEFLRRGWWVLVDHYKKVRKSILESTRTGVLQEEHEETNLVYGMVPRGSKKKK